MTTGTLNTTGTIHFAADDVRLPGDVLTLDGFLDWMHSEQRPVGGAFAYLAGEVYVDMSPEEFRSHNWLKDDFARGLGNWTVPRELGRTFTDGALLVNEDAGLSTEPDYMFCLGETLLSSRVRLVERKSGSGRLVELHGSPDLTVEIVSDSSVRKDTRDLRELYFKAGIREYWLIDARSGEPDFQILARGESEFEANQPDDDGYIASDVLGGKFRFVHSVDRYGADQYELLGKD